MNRYPLWKYITVLVAVLIGLLYTRPNFYGESPAVQVSSAKATVKVDTTVLSRVEQILADAKIPNEGAYFELNGTLGTVRARFPSTDVQLQARDLIEKSLNTVPGDPHYTVALNLLFAAASLNHNLAVPLTWPLDAATLTDNLRLRVSPVQAPTGADNARVITRRTALLKPLLPPGTSFT